MRLFAAADLHGKRPRFAALKEGLCQSRADAVVLAGDILNYGRGRPLLAMLEALPVPVFMVRGNSDPPRLDRWAGARRNVHALHLKALPFQGFTLAGIDGTLPIPFHSRAGWRETSHLKRLAALIDSRSILVAHPPPYGCLDKVLGRFSAGSRGLRRLVGQTAPPVMICGHIHEAAGVDRLGNTLVVNCALGRSGRGAVIELREGRGPTVTML